jgi:hypothetical protein
MAVWRDPLDELIADLERALPPETKPQDVDYQATLLGCQILVSAILFGTDDSVARAEQDPRVKAFLAFMERLGPCRYPPGTPAAAAEKTDSQPEPL